MVKVGPRILELLTQKHIKVAELATALEVSAQSVHGQLSKDNVGTSYLQRVMTATGIKSWEIFQDGDYVPAWQASDPSVSYQLRPNEAPSHLLHSLAEQDSQLALQASVEMLRDLEGSDIPDTSDASKLRVLREYPHLVSSLLSSITHHRHQLMQPTSHSVRPPRNIPTPDKDES